MAIGTIYLIINKVNGHKYIGQTTQGMNKRWKQHIDEAMRMSKHPLHRAMRKHGNHNFMIREICECNESELDEKEQYYIKEYNTSKSTQGYNHTEEDKEDIPDTIELDKKEKEDNNWGFHLAENRGNGSHASIKILGINIETGIERMWDSISDATIELTGDIKKSGNIVNAMNKGYKAYGYLWKRLDPKRSTKIYGVHKITWEKTPIFESIKQAAKILNINEDGIRRSIKNPRRRSYKKHYWYKLDN